MARKLRIGIITHNYPVDLFDRKDAGMFIHDFAYELSAYAKVFILCPKVHGKSGNFERVSVTWFDWGGGGAKFGNWLFFNPLSVMNFFKLLFFGRKAAIEFAKDNNLDFILGAWLMPSGVFAWAAGAATGVPFATWALGSDINKYAKFPILRQLIIYSLRRSRVNFANSYKLCNIVEVLSDRECKFLPAITEFGEGKVYKRRKSNKVFRFLFVGRLERVKGVDVLIDAASRLEKKGIAFKLDLVGDGTLRGVLEKKMDGLGLSGRVEFVGFRDKAEVISHMKESDCLVLASRSESLPLVILEAARVGLPVVATDVGDCKRIIEEYKMGYCVSKEDSQMLALALERMIKSRFEVIGKAEFSRVSRDFSQCGAVRKFLSSIDLSK